MPLRNLRLEQLCGSHVPSFLALAKGEGWLCAPWELQFLLDSFHRGCWALLDNGRPGGFVTSIKYDTGGWVGNLLVRKDLRGRGLGRSLLEHALAALSRAGADTVWLTASPAGQPLYEKLGFAAIDRITRWRRCGRFGGGNRPYPHLPDAVTAMDRLGWGDGRDLLLHAVAGRGRVVSTRDGFCMMQAAGEWSQIGPWGCRDGTSAEELLDRAFGLALTEAGATFADAPEANPEAAGIFRRLGFSPCGATVLMFRGKPPAYRPEHVYALASMGSIG